MLMLKLPFHHLTLSFHFHRLAMPFRQLIFGKIIKIALKLLPPEVRF